MSSRPYGAPADDRADYSAHDGDAHAGAPGSGPAMRRATSYKDVRWPADDSNATREAIKNWATGVKDG